MCGPCTGCHTLCGTVPVDPVQRRRTTRYVSARVFPPSTDVLRGWKSSAMEQYVVWFYPVKLFLIARPSCVLFAFARLSESDWRGLLCTNNVRQKGFLGRKDSMRGGEGKWDCFCFFLLIFSFFDCALHERLCVSSVKVVLIFELVECNSFSLSLACARAHTRYLMISSRFISIV